MKRFVCLLLTLIMLLSLMSVASFAVDDSSHVVTAGDNFEYAEKNTDEDYVPFLDLVIAEGSYEGDLEDLRYYPFVYSNDDSFKWFRDVVVGPNDCEEGHLYVKDQYTENIWEVLNGPVTMIQLNDNTIYCILDENKLVEVDYFGNNYRELYCSSNALDNLAIWGGNLYFTEKDNVKVIDTKTQEAKSIGSFKGISTFYIENEDSIVWEDVQGDIYNHDMPSGTDELIDSASYSKDIAHIHASVTSPAAEPTAIPSGPVSLPLGSYPSGSYFTYSGGACGHHGTGTCDYYGGCNCRAYSGAIQCTGFAKYASDQYAHKATWSPVSGDTRDYVQIFSNDANVRSYFAALSKGAYIRLSNKYGDDDVGLHSIVLISTGSNYIKTYECNNGGNDCHVSVETRSLGSLHSGYFDRAIYSVSHRFTGTAKKYSSSYHKIPCSSSGCTGYILQIHYSSNPGANATCSACGYVGKIDSGVLSSLPISGIDEYMEVHNEETQ